MSKSEYTPEELSNYVFRKLKNVNKPTSLPNKNVLDILFKRLFFASLKTEEGQFIRVTVTLINPENPDPSPPDRVLNDRWQFVRFKDTIPFTVKNLIKLSKAADPWSSSLAIYYNDKDELLIWGMIDQAIHYQSFLNYETENSPEQPGLFQVTITGIGSLIIMSNYELIATLKQDILISNYIDIFKKGEIHGMLKSNTALFKGIITDVFKPIIKADRLSNWDSFIENLIYGSLSRILIRIQNYNHGGAFLITLYVTEDIDIKYSISYDRLFDSILALVKSTICSNIFENNVDFEMDRLLKISPYAEQSLIEEERRDTTNELKGAIRFISSLTCVDGLVVFTPELKVKGFGAVIKLKTFPEIIYISETSSITTAKFQLFNANHFGTRHRSMFSFCWNNLGSIGFVVSQDGDIRVITRIADKLIMWENVKVQQFIISSKMKH